jgi:hypothetical protein
MYPNIRAELARKNISIPEFAKIINLNRTTTYERLNGQTEWKKSEIDKIIDFFQKPYEYLFFTDDVRKNRTEHTA